MSCRYTNYFSPKAGRFFDQKFGPKVSFKVVSKLISILDQLKNGAKD